LIVLPAIDIMNGKVVQLVGGVPGTERIVLPDPIAVAHDWEDRGAPGLHVIDLDAAMGKGSNLPIIRRILAEIEIPVQVGGGVRSESMIADLISFGASRVITGTKGILDRPWLKCMAEKWPGKLMLAIDVRESKVLIKGWQEPTMITLDEIFRNITALPLAGVLYTDVDVEGKNAGIDATKTKAFIDQCPHNVFVAGGIKNREDINLLEKLGACAAVVGMAMYTGGIAPSDVWRRR
jgi:phosphoribosylformimino-5-aminoimidazole carboxamide ribotide isomerase